ncbi:MAG: cupin domain-containing protein [Mangrovibacterium sp.]
MEKFKKIAEGENFTAVNFGTFNKLTDNAQGKVFLKEYTQATGCEISFGSLPAHAQVPFLHKHQQNEENYIIISGKGCFDVDGQSMEVSEGSVVRIAPQGVRCLKNTSAEELVYITIQSKANSLEQHTASDGVIL